MSTAGLTVKIKNGQLRGTIRKSIEGFSYCAFKGIPYAKPPVGTFRFIDPEPFTENWEGIRDATSAGNICLQYDPLSRTCCGSDDCLYLNVYIKSMENVEVLKPVMFYIHGGAFYDGSGDNLKFGPDYLLRKDIVLVTFNYRLGIFGFLNLDCELASGNQGLKDQVMALRWVQENIKSFGGDPNNVTVFGESVGGCSAHYLVFSPMSKGLFHKIICQSGVIFNPFALIDYTKENVKKLCQYLEEFSDDPEDILELLRMEDGFKLVEAQKYVRSLMKKGQYIYPFGPVIDSISPNPFMPDSLEEIASKGIPIPCIIGYNNREGILYLIDDITFREIEDEEYERRDKNFAKSLHSSMINVLKRYNLTPDDVKLMYFGNEKISKATRGALADFYGDVLVERIERAIKIQAITNSAPTYVYKFSFNNDQSTMKSKFSKPISGACHFDDVEYIFCNRLRKKLGLKMFEKGSIEYVMMERMVEMWTNFAKYGSPTPSTSELLPVKWQPLNSATNMNYLNIDKELHMETAPYLEQFFLSKSQKYANKQ